MAYNVGMQTSFQNANIQLEAISDVIDMLGWTQAAMLKTIGLNNEKKFNFVSGTWPTRQYEWMSDTLPPDSSTIAEDLDTSETGVDMASGTGKYFRDGDVIKIDDEYMRVTGVSTDTVTVTRAYAGTTAASHTTAATAKLLYSARLEGQDATDSLTTEAELLYNVRQILETTTKVAGSELTFQHTGVQSIEALALAKAIGGEGVGEKFGSGYMVKQLMNIFYYGLRNKASANTDADAAGGMQQFVTSATHKVNIASAALTRKHIIDLLQTIYEDGGQPDYIVCGMWARRKISSFFEDQLRSDRSEAQGGRVIQTLDWEGGSIDIMYDAQCPSNHLWVLNMDLLGFLTIRPFDVYDLARTGDSQRKEVIGEYGFGVRRPNQDHGFLYGFSTSK